MAEMVTHVVSLNNYDCLQLREPCYKYAAQEEIPPECIQALTTCAIHYGCDLGLVACYLDEEYAEAWHQPYKILDAARPFVSPTILISTERIITRECPSCFHWEEPAWNKEAFLRRDNNPSVNQHMDVDIKTLNKEEISFHVMVFIKCVVVFPVLANVVPHQMLVKPNKKPRLIWDGKTKTHAHKFKQNEKTDMSNKTVVIFRYVYLAFCT